MALAKILFFLFLPYHLFFLKADSKCPESFPCGRLGNLTFPFTTDPECGLALVTECESGSPKTPLISEGPWHSWYEVRNINVSTNKVIVHDPTLQNHLDEQSCCLFNRNLSLPHSPFISFTLTSPNLTFITCPPDKDIIQLYNFQNYSRVECSNRLPNPPVTAYFRNPTTDIHPTDESNIPTECSVIQLPKKPHLNSSEWFSLLSAEFAMEWSVSEACSECHRKGGRCLTDNENEFYCREEKQGFKAIFLIGGLIVAALTSTLIILFLFIRRKNRLLGLRKGKSASEKDIELFLENNGSLAPLRYTYSDIKKMTKSFSEILGKGGYGNVYKGKLPDGRPVAVKILNESKGNGEEFMNEVASISRTSHINIVSLLGFCFEGSNRALIYEFMPNGSLEKFIQNNSSSTKGGLGWQKLFEIALGIARGLEYLHQGCKTRIVHFDIKPQNILLDKDLNPRISDFGLAKLCPNRASIVSMLVARGTIGYIAPEVFCRNFGEVSHKSDVYSYGMMILEIAGGKKNIDPRDVDRTSETYFPQYIYKQLEMDAERDGSLAEITNEDQSFAKRKLIIVGLWCIQTDPKDRPSMTKVVEMLEGKLESLQVPPKPHLHSPPRSVPNFSVSESM